jgi:hypothetical protein
MVMSKSLEEIRQLTASILDAGDADEYVSQITEDSIKEMESAEYKDLQDGYAGAKGMDAACNMYYGHDMRYDGGDYLFRAGDGCGMKWWRLKQSSWNHHFLNRRCGSHNNLAQLKFTRR